jgi:DNA adenine methylase
MAFTDSPLRYPGGKASLHHLMRDVIAHNSLRYCRYAEPFAGGAGLALRLLFDGVVSKVHLNDLDPAIWAFWHSVLDRTEELAAMIEAAPVTISEWRRHRETVMTGSAADPLELGFAAFFLNRTNRSGIIKSGGVIGGLDQTGNYLIDCRFNRPDLAGRVRRIGRYRDRIHLSRLDALEFLDAFERHVSGPVFLCIDPPYFAQGSSLYSNFYRPEDHAVLARRVQQLNQPWLMTYDDAPRILDLYGDRRRFRFSINYSAQNKRQGTELMVVSDDLDLPKSVEARLSAA